MTEISRLVQQGEISAAMDDRTWITCALAEFEAPLLRYAYFFVQNKEWAQDIVQETFVSLCQQNQSFGEGHLKQWLYRVCRNKAIDLCRKEKRMSHMTESHSEVLADRQPGPAQSLLESESKETLLTQIARLPARQQEVLRLKFQSGFSYQEIANVTGLTKSNVGVLLHTAVTKLRGTMSF